MAQSHVRIDEGIKRGPRTKRIVRKSEVERTARSARDEKGRVFSLYTAEQRNSVIAEAIAGLEVGIVPEQVAQKHDIPRSTLYSWLLDDDTAQQARSRFFHYQIGRSLDSMERCADNPLDLARWRDLRRAWAETAAVRDPKNYASKQEVSVSIDHQVLVEHSLTTGASELLGRIRKGNPVLTIHAEPVPETVDVLQAEE